MHRSAGGRASLSPSGCVGMTAWRYTGDGEARPQPVTLRAAQQLCRSPSSELLPVGPHRRSHRYRRLARRFGCPSDVSSDGRELLERRCCRHVLPVARRPLASTSCKRTAGLACGVQANLRFHTSLGVSSTCARLCQWPTCTTASSFAARLGAHASLRLCSAVKLQWQWRSSGHARLRRGAEVAREGAYVFDAAHACAAAPCDAARQMACVPGSAAATSRHSSSRACACSVLREHCDDAGAVEAVCSAM